MARGKSRGPGMSGDGQAVMSTVDAEVETAPAFEHHARLPVLGIGGAEITVFTGSLADATSAGA